MKIHLYKCQMCTLTLTEIKALINDDLCLHKSSKNIRMLSVFLYWIINYFRKSIISDWQYIGIMLAGTLYGEKYSHIIVDVLKYQTWLLGWHAEWEFRVIIWVKETRFGKGDVVKGRDCVILFFFVKISFVFCVAFYGICLKEFLFEVNLIKLD